MSNTQAPIWRRWGQFRFSVIGELLSSPPAKGQLQQEIQRLSQKIYQHPIDEDRKFTLGASTIERWYYKAKVADDPVVVLGRKPRSDAGICWVMPEALLDALNAQYQRYPRWTVQLHYDNLKVVVQENDDHSRICCYLQFYLAETAECLVHGLIQTFMKRRLARTVSTEGSWSQRARNPQNSAPAPGLMAPVTPRQKRVARWKKVRPVLRRFVMISFGFLRIV